MAACFTFHWFLFYLGDSVKLGDGCQVFQRSQGLPLQVSFNIIFASATLRGLAWRASSVTYAGSIRFDGFCELGNKSGTIGELSFDRP